MNLKSKYFANKIFLFALLVPFLAYPVSTVEILELRETGFTDKEIIELIKGEEMGFGVKDFIELKKQGFSSEFILELKKVSEIEKPISKTEVSRNRDNQDSEKTKSLREAIEKKYEYIKILENGLGSLRETMNFLSEKSFPAPFLYWNPQLRGSGVYKSEGFDVKMQAPRRDAERSLKLIKDKIQPLIDVGLIDGIFTDNLIDKWVYYKERELKYIASQNGPDKFSTLPEEEINQYKQLYDVAQARFIAVFTQKKLEINLEIRTSLLSIDALKMQLEQQFSGDYEEEIGGFLEKGKKVRGLKDGLSELFDKNGKLIKTVEWKRGLRHGSEKIVDSYSEPITWSLGIPLKYYSIQGFKEFSFEFKPDTKRVSFKVSENSKEILDSEFLFLSKEEILEETRDLPTAFFVKDNIGFVQSALILDGNFTYYSEQSDSFLTGNFSNGAPLSLNWEFSDGQKYSLRYGDSQEKDILTGTFSGEGIVASLIGTFVTGYGFEGRTFCEENGFTEQTEFTKGKESHILIHNGDHKLFDYELGKDANKHTVYAKSGKKAIQFETHKYTDDEFDLGGAFIKYDEFEIPRLKCNYNTRPRENMTSLNMATKGNLLKWEVYYKNTQLAFKVFPAILPKAKNFNTRSVQSYYEDGTEYQSMSFFSKGIKLYKRKGQLWRKGEFKNSRDIFGENGLKNLGLSAVPIGTHYEYDENGKTLKTIECDGLNSFGILYPELLTFREIKSVDKIENYHDKHLLMLDDLNPKDYTKHSDYFFPKKSKAHNIFRQITTKQVAIRPLSEISNFFRKIQIFNKENHDNENHFFSFQNSYSSFTKFATQDAVQSFSKTSFDNKFFEWMENPSSFGGTKVLQKIRRTLQNKETELDLYKSQIVNITPITNLDKLKKLILSENQVTNLSPLKGLLSLNELALTQNKISDLSPLAGLEGLEELYLGENPISDISPLSNLLGLKILVLRNCKVTNIEPLMKLKSLEKLSLEGNLISFQQKNLIQTSLPYTKISFD